MAAREPVDLAKLKGLKVRARAVVDGVLSGLHKSPHQGQSVEFAEHKEYAPGDELRHLDWKAYGKFDRFYVKRFEHETNLRAALVVDASGSMGYGSAGLTKLDVAATLAGAMATLLVRQQDAAGLMLLSKGARQTIPPRATPRHLQLVLDALESLSPDGVTDLAGAADALGETLPRRSLVAVFSDFLDDRSDALSRVLSLAARKHDVSVFHVVDRDELEFPFEDPTRFVSMEDERNLEVNARDIRESYLEEFGRFLESTKAACGAAGVDYVQVRTDEALDRVLVKHLGRRVGSGP